VTGAVSGRSAVLVTDGVDATTVKAVAARRLGIRVGAPDNFALLLAHIEPA
jgi:hypothetical protein